jgi:16S rRNA (guanine966-N2)-methyltransferase
MRVIAGTARRTGLKSVPGHDTRPIPDRIKESVFAMLTAHEKIEGAAVMDLYAGSGSLGIEALSRGAASAIFVERSRDCVRVIEQNLEKTRLADQSRVISSDVVGALSMRVTDRQRFDLIFFDPPFPDTATGLPADDTALVLAAARLNPDGWLLIRCEADRPPPACPEGCEVIEVRRWGRSEITFLEPSA